MLATGYSLTTFQPVSPGPHLVARQRRVQQRHQNIVKYCRRAICTNATVPPNRFMASVLWTSLITTRPLVWRRSIETGQNMHYETTTTLTPQRALADRKSTRLNSSHANISYAVFCLKKKKNKHP